MERIECKICQKTFTGLVCFQQHEVSEKHKRKVLLSKTGATSQHQGIPNNNDSIMMRCSVCEISVMGMSNYEKHVNSMQHADMVKQMDPKKSFAESESAKENRIPDSCMPVSFSVVTLKPFATCDVCGMQFSGPEPYQQHLASEKHKKKSFRNDLFGKKRGLDTVDGDKIMPFFNSEDGSKNENKHDESKNKSMHGTVKPFAECCYCDMQFSGIAPYQLHVDSAAHLRKVSNSSMNSSENPKTGSKMSVAEQEVPVLKGVKETAKPYADCSFCNMTFTGPEPYQLHVDSEAHIRKVSFTSGNHVSESPKTSSNQLKCDVCNKNFSGPIPYDDHMRGKEHKKKIQNIGFLQNISTTSSMEPDSTTNYPLNNNTCMVSPIEIQNQWYCKVCDKQSTGQIPHEAHLVSQGHQKKIRAAEMESSLKLKREMLMQPHIEESIKMKKEQENNMLKENQVNSNLAYNTDFYISNDLILCDALKNIGVIPEEDLNVTVFYPEDEIVFA